MDNISHSVAGLAIGEIIQRTLPSESTPEKTRLRRKLLLFACCFASNFPDLDLLLTPLLPPPLGYLLHHRGHTHTILYAIPQAILLILMTWILWPGARTLLKESRLARKGFGLSIGVGFSLHLLMDYLNSYGIHPFHPFDSNWIFGDMVFIVEPFFWVAFGVPFVLTFEKLWARILGLAFLLGVPLAFTFAGFLPWVGYGALAFLSLVIWIVRHKSDPRGLTPFVMVAFLGACFVGLQSFASGMAKKTLIARLHEIDPQSRYLDSAMSSFPTNPICWSFVSVEKNEDTDSYRLRRGLLSLAPKWLPVRSCPKALAADAANSEDSELALGTEESGRLSQLRRLRNENCHFEAWLRFSRAPMIDDVKAWDIRFSSKMRANFTTLTFSEFSNRECSPLIPKWGIPREDLLEATK